MSQLLFGILAGLATALAALMVVKIAGLYKVKPTTKKVAKLEETIHRLGLDSDTDPFDNAVSEVRARIFGSEFKKSA